MVKENIFRKKKDLLKTLLENLSIIEIENIKNLVGLYYTSTHSFKALCTEDYFTVAIQSIDKSDPEIALINNVDRIVIQNAREKVIAAILFLKPELLTLELSEYFEQIKVYKDLIDHRGLIKAQIFAAKYWEIRELTFLTYLFKSYSIHGSIENYFLEIDLNLTQEELIAYNRSIRDYLKGKKWKGFPVIANRALFGFLLKYELVFALNRINDLFYLILNTNLHYLDKDYFKLQKFKQFIEILLTREFNRMTDMQLKYYQEKGICTIKTDNIKPHKIIVTSIDYIKFINLDYKKRSIITFKMVFDIFQDIANSSYIENPIYKDYTSAFTEAFAIIKSVLVTRFDINIENLNLILNTRFETILQSLRELLSQES